MANRKRPIILRCPVTMSEHRDTAHASIKETEDRTAELSKHAATYRQFKPLYDLCWQSRDKEKFLRGYESENILFEAAAREVKKMGSVPLPSTKSMKAGLAALTAKMSKGFFSKPLVNQYSICYTIKKDKA